MESLIYLDNAATTRVAPCVVEKMIPYFSEQYANPSGVYGFSQKAKQAVAKARAQIAKAISANPREIYFTSGGSEADNWALLAGMESLQERGRHLITSQIEHPAVLNTCHELERRGFEVSYVPVDKEGRVLLGELEKAIRPDTVLISIMAANNEVGTIQPIEAIGALAHEHGCLFHTDAVQAIGHMPIHVLEQSIDLLSASGHKFYGPKGIGFLYCRDGVPIHSLIRGGAQERGRRAGTENVPGIVGMGYAIERVCQNREEIEREQKLRDDLIHTLEKTVPNIHCNGARDNRLCNNVNVRFDGIRAESLLIRLDMDGVCASAGSACASGSLSASHVLLAMGLSEEEARSSLRFTLGESTTKEEIHRAAELIAKHVAALRER